MFRYAATFLMALAVPLFAGDVVLEVKPCNNGADVPCCVTIGRENCVGQVVLLDEQGNKIPCQAEGPDAKGQCVLRWIEKSIEKDKVLTRKLVAGSAPAPAAVELKQGEGKVDVLVNGKLLTTYNYSVQDPKPYCWPIIGPTGKPVTRAYPMIKDAPGEQHDHHHHRSWYFTFGSVNGTDYWSETDKSGLTRHVKFEELVSGPVFGEIVARNNWMTVAGKKDLEDVRSYRFYNMPDHCLIDWDVRLLATEGPVKMGDTKEGMASFRVASSMIEKNGGRLTNSEGKVGEKECWGKQAAWVDFSGNVDGETVGIALFGHPASFRHPTYWHARGYGLFGANPFGTSAFLRDKTKDGSHTIPAGGELRFSYRVYIHKGAEADARVAEKYENFANPPAVTVKEEE